MNLKKICPTLRNAAVQAAFWGAYCAIYSYASVYLLDRGVTSGQIGIILAIGNALSVILQPVIGNIADRGRKMILRPLLAGCIVPQIALCLLLFAGGSAPAIYVLLVALLQTVQPLLHSLCAFFMERRVNINFGISRGMGSLWYAALSSFLGVMVAKTGAPGLLWVAIGMLVLLLVAVLTYRFRGVTEEKPQTEKSRASLKRFAAENRRFLITLIGVVLLFSGFCAVSVYLFQIVSSIGLGSAEMGYAMTMGAMMELPTLFLLALLNRRVHSGRLLKISAWFMVLKVVVLALARSFGVIMLAWGLQFAGFALYAGISVYYVTQVIEEKHQALGQSLLNAANTLGNLVACLLGGWLLDTAGIRALLLYACIFSAAGAAVITLAAGRGKKLPAPAQNKQSVEAFV